MHIHLIEGPVGAGKSTYGQRLATERTAVRLCLDDWMGVLFRPDRPETDVLAWYQARKQRCLDQILRVAAEVLERERDVVLELGLIQRQDREAFYASTICLDHALTVHVLDAPRETRLERVRRRNAERGATFHAVVSDELFALADSMWQPPAPDEVEAREIVFV